MHGANCVYLRQYLYLLEFRRAYSGGGAALCQMGSLHYLLVTANQEEGYPSALNIHQFAERIAQTGCIKAYTLDGGQTAAIALGGELVNRVLYGQQRAISDIIYFATSVGG